MILPCRGRRNWDLRRKKDSWYGHCQAGVQSNRRSKVAEGANSFPRCLNVHFWQKVRKKFFSAQNPPREAYSGKGQEDVLPLQRKVPHDKFLAIPSSPAVRTKKWFVVVEKFPPVDIYSSSVIQCVSQGRSDWGIWVYIPPKSVQVNFLWGKMTLERLLNMSIKVLYLPKNFIPPKQISGYAPNVSLLCLLWLCPMSQRYIDLEIA